MKRLLDILSDKIANWLALTALEFKFRSMESTEAKAMRLITEDIEQISEDKQ